VAQKIVSKAEGRYADLATVRPSERALRLAAEVRKDAGSSKSSWEVAARCAAQAGVLIVEHRLGFILANRALRPLEYRPQAGTEPVLLIAPHDLMARRPICERFARQLNRTLAVIIHRQLGACMATGHIGVALVWRSLPRRDGFARSPQTCSGTIAPSRRPGLC
jgi:coenzyme F420-0:L-glutamate ligase/coenzyme F420-1:gamma-L-glutamate ligase